MKKLNYFKYKSTGTHGKISDNGEIDNTKDIKIFNYDIIVKYFVTKEFMKIEKVIEYLDLYLKSLEHKILPIKLCTLEGLTNDIFIKMSEIVDIYEVKIFEPDENIGAVVKC